MHKKTSCVSCVSMNKKETLKGSNFINMNMPFSIFRSEEKTSVITLKKCSLSNLKIYYVFVSNLTKNIHISISFNICSIRLIITLYINHINHIDIISLNRMMHIFFF